LVPGVDDRDRAVVDVRHVDADQPAVAVVADPDLAEGDRDPVRLPATRIVFTTLFRRGPIRLTVPLSFEAQTDPAPNASE
jgi:hypothetical protein